MIPYELGKHFEILHQYIPKVIELFTPYLKHIPEGYRGYPEKLITPVTVNIFALFIAIRLLGAILFSSSFGLALMGAHTKGSFVLGRIKSVFREIIGLITGPFLIFDLDLS